MTNQGEKKRRDRLVGYVVIEGSANDYSEWFGQIAYPNPEGANLYWQNTLEMIEKKPGDLVLSADEVARLKLGLLSLRPIPKHYYDCMFCEAHDEPCDDCYEMHYADPKAAKAKFKALNEALEILDRAGGK